MIDYGYHMKPPRLDAAGGWILAARLARAAPPDLGPLEKKALKNVENAGERVAVVLRERDRLAPVGIREPALAFGARWSALHGQIAAWAKLTDDPRGARARALLDRLFRGGVSFLLRSVEQQYLESHNLLGRIEAEGLEEELGALSDPALLREVRAAHRALGERLGVGREPVESVGSSALRDAVRALALHVSEYVRTLAASVGLDDEAGEARFLAAIEPLRLYREQRAVGRTVIEDDEDVDLDTEPDPEEPIEGPVVADPAPAPV